MTKTNAESPAEGHPPFSALESYVREGVPGVLTLDGRPEIRIQIVPGERRLSLLVEPTDNIPGPDLSGFANIKYGFVDAAGTMWHSLDARYKDNLAEIYPILCSIADRIQVDKESFAHAVTSALSGVEQILAGRAGMSREKQIGLFGELVALASMASAKGAAHALKAWRGANDEEHDFGLKATDLEVKTTTSEDRVHWIGNLKQLRPSKGRPLHLLSIQITLAGAEDACDIPELVDRTRRLPGMPLSELNTALEKYGYRDVHADLYTDEWRLRSAPAFYLVDDQFPALTRDQLKAAVPASEKIVELRYRINVDEITPQEPLFYIELPGASA